MAQPQRERSAAAQLQKSGFVSLGVPKRTKAGSKLAVPRPVNLPSLKKENAGNEPNSTGGGSGWTSTGDAAIGADPHHHSDSAGPSSSLVEKASWAGHSRPAPQTQPAPWEQPRALNLREFPSLAAAAAASQHPNNSHRGGPAAPADSGAWDEDERGGPGRMLSTDRGGVRDGGAARREPPFEDGYGGDCGTRGLPPYYSRHRGDFSPPRDHRWYDGDEPPCGRYGGPPQHAFHGGGGSGYGVPRDQQRRDRFDGPPQRYPRHGPPPPHDYGRRYKADLHEPRERHHDGGGRFERGQGPQGGDSRDPSLFPPPPPHGTPPRKRDIDGRSRSRGPLEGHPAARGAAEFGSRPQLTEEQQVQPPPPPPPQQPLQADVERLSSTSTGAAERPAGSVQHSAAPAEHVREVQPLPDELQPEGGAAAAAPLSVAQKLSVQLRKTAGPGAEGKSAPASAGERRAASAARQQVNGSKAGSWRESQSSVAAPPPPPPPAVPKPLPPSPQPMRSSVVKPGLSWKALVVGVPDEPGPPPALLPLGGDGADKAGKRGRGKRQECKKEAPAAPTPAAGLNVTTATSKQRNKRATRSKKGQAPEDGAQQEADGDAASATSSGSKGQAGRFKGRGRGKEAGEQLAAQAAEEVADGLVAVELAPTAAVVPIAEPVPGAAAPEVPASLAQGPALVPAAEATAPSLQSEAPPLSAAPGAGMAAAAAAVPIMPAAFGWSSPLADEVAKLQLTATTGGAAQQAAPGAGLGRPLAGIQLVAGHMALLPTLGRHLQDPSTLLQPVQQQLPGPAAAAGPSPPVDSMADVIISLPADLTLDLGAAAPAPAAPGMLAASSAAPPPSVSQPFPSASPPPPSASPPPFPGGLFPATSSSWQAQPPSKEAVQLFEGAALSPAFGTFGSIANHMQFGAVAAAFGQQQQQQFGPGGGVDWSSPAPSPPPFVGTAGLAPAAVFGPTVMQSMQYAHPMHLMPPPGLGGGMGGTYGTPPQPAPGPQRLASSLEDPAAALPDDVFDMPVVQQQAPLQQHLGRQQGQANGQGPRARSYPNRNNRGRNARYPQQQPLPLPLQHGGTYGHQHGVYPPAGAGFPPHMPGWPSSQAPHFLPPQLVGPRQQQGSSGRGRARGRNPGSRTNMGSSRQPKPAPPQQQQQ